MSDQKIGLLTSSLRMSLIRVSILGFLCCGAESPAKAGLEIYCFDIATVVEEFEPNSGDLLVSMAEIEGWSSKLNELILDDEAWRRIKKKITMSEVGKRQLGFVITIDGQVVFKGIFWTVLFSDRTEEPVVLVENIEKERFLIQIDQYGKEIDKNEPFIQFLKALDKAI